MPAWFKNPFNWLFIGVIAGVTWYMVKLVQTHYDHQAQIAGAASVSPSPQTQQ